MARMEETGYAYRILVWKPLGRPRGRRDGNIKMDFREVCWERWVEDGTGSGLW
jgi:hypothetical protein